MQFAELVLSMFQRLNCIYVKILKDWKGKTAES